MGNASSKKKRQFSFPLLIYSNENRDHTGDSPIHVAPPDTERRRLWLESGAGVKLLLKSAKNGDVDLLRMVIGAGVDVNSFQRINSDHAISVSRKTVYVQSQVTSLELALKADNEECVQMLINHGAKANLEESVSGNTPLILAVTHCIKGTCVRMLLESGAQVNRLNYAGNTALHMCVISRSINTIARLGHARTLLDAGANLTIKNYDGHTVIESAIRYRLLPIFRMLTAELSIATSGKGSMITTDIVVRNDVGRVLSLIKHNCITDDHREDSIYIECCLMALHFRAWPIYGCSFGQLVCGKDISDELTSSSNADIVLPCVEHLADFCFASHQNCSGVLILLKLSIEKISTRYSLVSQPHRDLLLKPLVRWFAPTVLKEIVFPKVILEFTLYHKRVGMWLACAGYSWEDVELQDMYNIHASRAFCHWLDDYNSMPKTLQHSCALRIRKSMGSCLKLDELNLPEALENIILLRDLF